MKMGDVAAKLRIMPKDVEIDLEQLKEKISMVLPENVKLHGFSIEPIAFGLRALNVVVLVADAEGGTEEVEQLIEGLDDVESVSVVEVGRI